MTAIVAAAAVAACSGGDGGTEPTPTIDIALSAATLSVAQGASGKVNVTLTRGGGFTGPVTIDVEGEPTGVTPTPAPVSIAAGSTSSEITIAVGATATAGPTNLTVRASGTGVTAKTQTLALTVTAAAVPSYSVAISAPTVSVAQGANGTATVTVTRTGGFTGAVALTAEGLPTGVTAAFNPASVTGATTTSTLTLTAAANATAGGPTTVTVKGTATGQAEKTVPFQLNVTAAPVGGFTLSLAPTTVAVQQGGTGTSTVTITRTNNFAGAVTFATTGLPNGVTAVFNPTAPTTNTSTLTLTASATATVGQATVTVHGNSGTLAEQTATLTVNVTAVTGGSGNTTWQFCAATGTPLWVAIQDGNSAWTRVNPTGTKYQFNIAAGRGGVAYVTGTTGASTGLASRSLARRMSGEMQTALLMRNKGAAVRTSAYAARASSLVDGFGLTIFYGTQAELNAEGTSKCPPSGTGKTVNGSVAGIGASQTAYVGLGDTTATVMSATGTTFQFTDVPDGALDLIGSRSTSAFGGITTTVDKLIIRRGLNQANNSTIPVLDFNAAEAFAPAEANITVGNLGTDPATVLTSFYTSSTSAATLFAGFEIGTGPFKYYGVPTAKQLPADLHVALAFTFPINGTEDDFRSAALFFKDPIDRTVTLGAALPAPTVSTLAATPYVRFRAAGSATAAYNTVVTARFDQTTTAVRSVTINATAGFLNNATSYDLSIPDFTGVAGWDNNWGPKVGVATNWFVIGTGFTGIGVTSPNPVEGATFRAAGKSGTITP